MHLAFLPKILQKKDESWNLNSNFDFGVERETERDRERERERDDLFEQLQAPYEILFQIASP